MMDFALFIECGDGFGAGDFTDDAIRMIFGVAVANDS